MAKSHESCLSDNIDKHFLFIVNGQIFFIFYSILLAIFWQNIEDAFFPFDERKGVASKGPIEQVSMWLMHLCCCPRNNRAEYEEEVSRVSAEVNFWGDQCCNPLDQCQPLPNILCACFCCCSNRHHCKRSNENEERVNEKVSELQPNQLEGDCIHKKDLIISTTTISDATVADDAFSSNGAVAIIIEDTTTKSMTPTIKSEDTGVVDMPAFTTAAANSKASINIELGINDPSIFQSNNRDETDSGVISTIEKVSTANDQQNLNKDLLFKQICLNIAGNVVVATIAAGVASASFLVNAESADVSYVTIISAVAALIAGIIAVVASLLRKLIPVQRTTNDNGDRNNINGTNDTNISKYNCSSKEIKNENEKNNCSNCENKNGTPFYKTNDIIDDDDNHKRFKANNVNGNTNFYNHAIVTADDNSIINANDFVKCSNVNIPNRITHPADNKLGICK